MVGALAACLAGAVAAYGQTTTTAPATQQGVLRLFVAAADHPSGIYYAKDNGVLTLMVENPTDAVLPLEGQLEFGYSKESGEAADKDLKPEGEAKKTPAFTALSVTPITPTSVPPHQRVKLPLAVTFTTPGAYEVRFGQITVPSEMALPLQCIYPPRGLGGDAGGPPADLPWVSVLPFSALQADVLTDYIQRTGLKRMVVEEPWPVKAGGEGPRGSFSQMTIPELTAVFKSVAENKGELYLRVVLQADSRGDVTSITAFHRYLSALLGHSQKTIKAIALDSTAPLETKEEVDAYRSYYLALYEAAKKHDPAIVMLGTSEARLTRRLLGSATTTTHPATPDYWAYVDAIAAIDDPADFTVALTLAQGKKAVWNLNRRGGSPAVLLAEGVARIPVIENDHGVTAHLLGGAACFERLHPGLPPYVAIFQGNGYAVAAIAGLGAGTPLDVGFPELVKRTRKAMDAQKNEAVLEVADDNNEMRVVDELGREVNCRSGDLLLIPLDDKVRYLLQSGSAEDLAALLRTAQAKGMPLVLASEARLLPAGPTRKTAELNLKLRNLTAHELGGTLRVYAAGSKEAATEPLGQRAFVPITSNKMLELTIPLENLPTTNPTEFMVEVLSRSGTDRFPLSVSAK